MIVSISQMSVGRINKLTSSLQSNSCTINVMGLLLLQINRNKSDFSPSFFTYMDSLLVICSWQAQFCKFGSLKKGMKSTKWIRVCLGSWQHVYWIYNLILVGCKTEYTILIKNLKPDTKVRNQQGAETPNLVRLNSRASSLIKTMLICCSVVCGDMPVKTTSPEAGVCECVWRWTGDVSRVTYKPVSVLMDYELMELGPGTIVATAHAELASYPSVKQVWQLPDVPRIQFHSTLILHHSNSLRSPFTSKRDSKKFNTMTKTGITNKKNNLSL